MGPAVQGLRKGRYSAELATDGAGIDAALELRRLCFRGGTGPDDRDAFDAASHHLLVRDSQTGELVACCRLMLLPDAPAVEHCYSAQVYDLSILARRPGPMLEVGRFCIRPGRSDPDILRIAWGALTREVDAAAVTMLIGCSSFRGADPGRHAAPLALLAAGHVAPEDWRPGIRAPEILPFPATPDPPVDPRAALAALPPLLRTYLAMGGRVSDHAVIDRDLDTLHVFTGVAIANVPAGRARLLRGVAADGGPDPGLSPSA